MLASPQSRGLELGVEGGSSHDRNAQANGYRDAIGRPAVDRDSAIAMREHELGVERALFATCEDKPRRGHVVEHAKQVADEVVGHGPGLNHPLRRELDGSRLKLAIPKVRTLPPSHSLSLT